MTTQRIIIRDSEGYDSEGRDRWGRNRAGFARSGWNQEGIHEITGTPLDPQGRTYGAAAAQRHHAKLRAAGDTNVSTTPAPAPVPVPEPAAVEAHLISVPEARAYLYARIALATRNADIPTFYMSAVVAPWLETFRDALRSDADQQAYRLYCATRSVFDAMGRHGEIQPIGRQFALTTFGMVCAENMAAIAHIYTNTISAR